MYDDEFHGLGGSYTQDPVTGKRTLVERTEPVNPIVLIESPNVQVASLGASTTTVSETQLLAEQDHQE